jgi:sortase A
VTDAQASIATTTREEERLTRSRPDADMPAPAAPTDHGNGQPDASDPTDGPPGRTIHVPDIPYLRLLGIALVGVGLLIVGFLIYLFAFTPLTAGRNQQQLAQSVTGQPLYRYSLVAGHTPPEGSAIGVIEIPAIGVHQVIVQGTSAADLMKGPGLMPGTALPGTPGNAVVAGRRVTFGAPFGDLGKLKRGDAIRVVDGAGTFTYKVTKTDVVSAGKRDVVTPTSDNRLTLVTSNSSYIPSGRLVVVAMLHGHAVAVPGDTVAVPQYELGLSGDPVAGGLAVLWSLITIIVLVGAGLAVWRWKRPGLIYLFAAPVVVACGLFACEAVARALPATF